MSTQAGTLQWLASNLVLALQPLTEAVADLPSFRTFLYRLGWQAKSVPPEYTALAAKVDAALTLLNGLGDNPQPAQILALLNDVRAIYQAIKSISSAPDGVDASQFLSEIGQRLTDLLLVDYLTAAFPGVYSVLASLGVITQENVNQTPTRPGFLLTQFHWNEIPKILNDPSSIPQRVYGWGTDDLEFHRISGDLLQIFLALDWPAHIGPLNRDLGQGFMDAPNDLLPHSEWELRVPVLLDNIGGKEIEVGLSLLELPPMGERHAGLILQPLVPAEVGTSYAINDSLRLELRAGSDISKTFGVMLRPDGLAVRFPFEPGTALPQAGFGVTLRYAPASRTLLLGDPAATRLSMQGAAAALELDTDQTGLEVKASVEVDGLNLVLSAQDTDSFLHSLLGGHDSTIAIPLTIQWSSRTGISFAGGKGFSVTQNTALHLGPVTIQALRLAILSSNDAGHPPDLIVEAGMSFGVSIGPVWASVNNAGLRLTMTFRDGNAGPFDFGVGFMPPNGVGLSIDAAGLTGGGFLEHDATAGRYEGALALAMGDINLAAYGLIATKLPTGGSGFSALVVISTEFSPGIELPFGFTLDGVGGLLGLDRTIAMDAVEAALWAHHFDNLLFPANPIAAAPALLTSLDTFFPAAHGRYLIGPLAKIGWGSIAEAVIGLFFELPEPLRVLLLGEVAVLVPHERPQLELHIDFAGGYDMAKQQAFFDASLHNSRIERYPIVGDLAFRYDWGSAPVLALAIGGFNPHFQPPANFPSLKRVGIAIGQSSVQLHAQAYFALTSNTLQFGANVELTAGSGDFNVHGFLGFDALCERSPLSFSFDLAAGVDLRAGTDVLASVHLDGHVSGPTPWHVAGDASLSLLFFDVSVHFDKSWGDDSAAAPPIDPMPDLRAALADRSSYGSILSAATRAVVAAASSPTDAQGAVLLDPAGMLRISQRVLPLGQPVTRFAGVPLGKSLTLSFDGLSVLGAAVSAPTAANEEFALAQFEDLTDAEKLSMPSFTQFAGGVVIGDSAVDLGRGTRPRATMTPFNYVTIIVDSQPPPREKPEYVLPLANLLAMNGRATPAPRGIARYAPAPGGAPAVTLAPEHYVIAGTDDTKARADIPSDGTKSGALAALAAYRAKNPTDAANLQVLLEQEAA